MPDPSLAEQLADFVVRLRPEDVPADVLDDARWRFVDWLGVAVAGSRSETSRVVAASAARMGGAPQATVVVFGGRLPVHVAGEVNAVTAQATDYDDFHARATVHASAVAVPAALAMGEYAQADGLSVLVAVLAGAEAGVRINSAVPAQRFHQRGLHGTGMAGPFIAAAVTCKLLGHDAAHTANALGLAGSQSAGLMQGAHEGAAVKQLHPGLAVHSGIKLALLSGHGVSGPRAVLEGTFGYYRSFLHGDEKLLNLGEVTRGLGREWFYPESAYKPLPTGAANQASLEAVAILVREAGIGPQDIDRIDCSIPPPLIDLVYEPRAAKLAPATPYEMKFSLPYCVAVVATRGTLRVEDFSAQTCADPQIASLARRVYCHADSGQQAGLLGARVSLTTTDGRHLVHDVPAMPGGPGRRPRPSDHRRKFLDNTTSVLGSEQAGLLLREAEEITRCADLRAVTRLTVPEGQPAVTA